MQIGSLPDRAMAIHAIDFNRVARFSIQVSIAMTVLLEMAVYAMHSHFQVNIFQVDSLFEFIRIIERHRVAVSVLKNAFAIVLERRPENPSMTVEVRELRVLEVLIEFRSSSLLQEVYVRPVATNRSPLRVSLLDLLLIFGAQMALLFRIHLVAIDLVIPPGVSKIRCDHVRAGMDVANDALARRNRSSELVLEWMARLIFWNRRIDRRRLAEISAVGIVSRVFRRTVVGVDNMAGAASAGAIVSGLIVGSRKR